MIHGSQTQALVVELTDQTHKILSGLSASNGGGDEGLNPHEILEASLAACTILTAQLYARRKNMPLTTVDAEVTIVKEGAETEISRKVKFNGDLSEADRTSLTTIVNKCPIHRLLESQIHITTTVET